MINVLFSHIEEKVSLSAKDRLLIEKFFSCRKLRKKQYLLQEGEICKNLVFVSKGLLRTYNIDEKGNEHMSSKG